MRHDRQRNFGLARAGGHHDHPATTGGIPRIHRHLLLAAQRCSLNLRPMQSRRHRNGVAKIVAKFLEQFIALCVIFDGMGPQCADS